MPDLHLNASFVRDVIGRYVTPSAVQQPNRTQTPLIVAHHAAWLYKPGDACRSIFSYHSSQWPKYGRIGYHEVIQVETDESLVCYQVNPPEMIGAGVWGMNEVCFHICCATHFKNDIPAQVWQDALALRVAAAKKRWPKATIVGHKEITKPGHGTDCPGGRWAEWKPDLLEAVARLNRPTAGRYQAGLHGAIAQQDRRPDALAAKYYEPGEPFESDGEQSGYVHDRTGIGFVPLGQVVRVS